MVGLSHLCLILFDASRERERELVLPRGFVGTWQDLWLPIGKPGPGGVLTELRELLEDLGRHTLLDL